jgi:hypothetical protein
MAENKHHGPNQPAGLPDLSNPENRFEHGDVNFKALSKFAIGLVITAIFSAGLVLGIFQYLLHREGGVPASRIESPAQDARQLPPEPRLEETPMTDLQEMRAAEDQVLRSYGWLDQPNGIVRLPIDRAMELIAQRGLPVRKEIGPQSAAAGVTVPTASALGPIMQQTGGPLAQQIQQGAK